MEDFECVTSTSWPAAAWCSGQTRRNVTVDGQSAGGRSAVARSAVARSADDRR